MKKHKEYYEDIKKEFMARDDITGIFYGYKIKNGQVTEDLCLSFQVDKKKPLSKIKKRERIPKKIDDLLTDVIEGEIKPLIYSGDIYQSTLRPGISVGPECKGKIGTWGALVYDLDNDNAKGILSNHHVMVDKYSSRNPYIKQPGNGIAFDDRIAELHSSKYYLGERGDFAFATLLDYRDVIDQIYGTNISIIGAKNPSLGDILEKVGRTTGYTQQRVILFGSFDINYSGIYSDNWFNLVTIEGFAMAPLTDPYENISDHGDSGSLYYLPNTNIGVGILTAGTPTGDLKFSYASYLTNALTDLNLSIIYEKSTWKSSDTKDLLATLIPQWVVDAPRYYTLEIIPQTNIQDVSLFTDSEFIDSIDGGIIWAKRTNDSLYMPVGGMSDIFTCNIGNLEIGVPISLDIMIKNSNNLSLNGEYVIPIYIGKGNKFASSNFEFIAIS